MIPYRQGIKNWGHLPGTLHYWALKEGRITHEAP